MGADFLLPVKRGDVPEEVAKKVEEHLGSQPNVTIECTGVESSIQTAIYVSWLRSQGSAGGRVSDPSVQQGGRLVVREHVEHLPSLLVLESRRARWFLLGYVLWSSR